MDTWDVYLKVEHSRADVLRSGVRLPDLGLDGSSVDANDAAAGGGVGGGGGSGDGSMDAIGTSAASAPADAIPHNLSPSPWVELSARLLDRDMRHFKQAVAQIGDAGAVAALINPKAVTTRHLHVGIELDGKQTRGMTVVDLRGHVFPPDKPTRPPNVHVVVDVDGELLKQVYDAAVLYNDRDRL